MHTITDPDAREIHHLCALGDLNHARVLEIGSGDGRLVWRYVDRATSIVGLEPDAGCLLAAEAARRAGALAHVAFLQADAARLPFRRGAFDRALFAWSL